jgi:hypothetical protein
MARPLRIEYEGALYHVTARGNVLQLGTGIDILMRWPNKMIEQMPKTWAIWNYFRLI